MNGTEVFNFTIKEVPKLFKEYYQEFGYSNDNFDLFVFHQANLYMLEYIAKKLKISPSQLPISIDMYGNTSSASIPLTICDYFNRHMAMGENKKKNIICSGFGIGLSLNITSFQMDGNKCFPIITNEEGYDDGVI